MKKNLTEIIFILDRSGSMSGMEADTIGGFNSMLTRQKKEEGDALVSTLLFDTRCSVLHDRLPIQEVPAMTENDYTAQGCTALLDAVGGAIHHIEFIHRYARPDDVPAHTLFIITTDGMENASRKYSAKKVKDMITEAQEKCGWEFIFLGANIDAVETAADIGIRAERAANFHNDAAGTSLNYDTLNRCISAVRRDAAEPMACLSEIEKDYRARRRQRTL